MSDDSAQDRYDVYRDANGLYRRPLTDNVRHLFEQTTERSLWVTARGRHGIIGQSRVAPSVSTKKAKRAK